MKKEDLKAISKRMDENNYQNFYEFPIKSLNYLVIICFDL